MVNIWATSQTYPIHSFFRLDQTNHSMFSMTFQSITYTTTSITITIITVWTSRMVLLKIKTFNRVRFFFVLCIARSESNKPNDLSGLNENFLISTIIKHRERLWKATERIEKRFCSYYIRFRLQYRQGNNSRCSDSKRKKNKNKLTNSNWISGDFHHKNLKRLVPILLFWPNVVGF